MLSGHLHGRWVCHSRIVCCLNRIEDELEFLDSPRISIMPDFTRPFLCATSRKLQGVWQYMSLASDSCIWKASCTKVFLYYSFPFCWAENRNHSLANGHCIEWTTITVSICVLGPLHKHFSDRSPVLKMALRSSKLFEQREFDNCLTVNVLDKQARTDWIHFVLVTVTNFYCSI